MAISQNKRNYEANDEHFRNSISKPKETAP